MGDASLLRRLRLDLLGVNEPVAVPAVVAACGFSGGSFGGLLQAPAQRVIAVAAAAPWLGDPGKAMRAVVDEVLRLVFALSIRLAFEAQLFDAVAELVIAPGGLIAVADAVVWPAGDGAAGGRGALALAKQVEVGLLPKCNRNTKVDSSQLFFFGIFASIKQQHRTHNSKNNICNHKPLHHAVHGMNQKDMPPNKLGSMLHIN